MTEIPWRWPRRLPGGPPAVLAHRGGTGPWRENTLEAFAGALGAGAAGVELDVRRSADGTLVVHHDAEVAGAGLVHELRRDQLPEWVPSLEAALATCAGAVVNVEIKNAPTEPGYEASQQVATDVADFLAALGTGPDPRPAAVIVSSFWPDSLGAVRAADEFAGRDDSVPGATALGATALGLLVHPAFDALAALDRAVGLGCAALHPHHSQVSPDLVERAHGLDVAVVTWTVNSPADLDAVVGAGADAVITDSVAETLAHLGLT